MTVAQVIEKLKTFDPQTEVVIYEECLDDWVQVDEVTKEACDGSTDVCAFTAGQNVPGYCRRND